MKLFETKKDYKKIFRTILQIIVVLMLLNILLHALFSFKRYQPYGENEVTLGENTGFIAISYLGVDRNGTPSLISEKRLAEELKSLKKNGYVTITQQDILDYYQNGKKLPEKSLYLMFEDGRRDTAIFAQNSLEENNYIGTVLTYAQKLKDDEQKFLTPKDLRSLMEQSFWEMGTNGYRLSYINVYDRYEHFLGQMSSLEYNKIKAYLGRDYNQYLMDFIRDENRIPLESTSEMEKRITYDYDLMEQEYTEGIGELPPVYVLMHANTGRFGNNDKVSAVNGANIMDRFAMNYNREGYSLNTAQSSIYDLTRMQVQPYWYTNHMLMRINADIKKELAFEEGDQSRKQNWETIKGAVEFKEDKIALTSLPKDKGLIQLKDMKLEDGILDTDLTGNKLGIQSVYLRADADRRNAVMVRLDSNVLSLVNIVNGKEEKLGEVDLDDLDEVQYASKEEDQKAALVKEYETEALYADARSNQYETAKKKQEQAEQRITKSVTEGAEAYIPDISISEPGKRHLQIQIQKDKITVLVDGRTAFQQEQITAESGSVFLESAFAGYGYSQRNISDDVYDGVFEKLEITTIPENGKSTVLYSNKLQTGREMLVTVSRIWNQVVNWFIETF
ncbi:MAG: glycoside hydrolase [Lachnospiraceae bacterium]|nr:glycoside hydrolase [Lachnospiraceae bacterium]